MTKATLLMGMCLCAAVSVAEEKKAAAPEMKPQIEVCFVLDTTGSMADLIEGAKAKIWSIANQIVKQKPTPEVKFALIGYRDRGDAYATKRFDMTGDVDAVFKNLSEFSAEGGGDEPESVNLALDEAVNKITWSADKGTLKVIFLVGDAPPHMDYNGEKLYPEICKEAVKRDLIVNTVQCGANAATTPVWEAIAKSSEGEYAAIAQGGNVAVVAAPQDKEIAALNVNLGTTFIACATSGQKFVEAQAIVQELQERKTTASVVADRASFLHSSKPTTQAVVAAADGTVHVLSGFSVSTGRNELLDLLAGGSVKLEDVKDEQLSPEMRKMSKEERAAHVAAKQKERAEIQARIVELSKARLAYLEDEKKKRVAAGAKPDSFDDTVNATLHKQAEAKRR
jgi:Mg-chelatase subunit ChlD